MTLYATEVDRSRREIFVADFGGDAVRVFPLAADGDVAPEREIAGPSTQLDQPIGIALDPVAGELFVRLYGTAKILVFPAGAAGDVVPSRVLIGAFPGQGGRGIAVDPLRGELFLTEQLGAGFGGIRAGCGEVAWVGLTRFWVCLCLSHVSGSLSGIAALR